MKHLIKFYFVVFLFAIFILGAYLYTTADLKGLMIKYASGNGRNSGMEYMEDKTPVDDVVGGNTECADLLVKKGNALLLYNTKKPDIKGENPLVFYNLDEYKQHLELQKKKGIQCPILYLQESGDTQGRSVYTVGSVQDILLPSMGGGGMGGFSQPMFPQQPAHFVNSVDANTLNPPYNQNMYSGFDATSQNVGRITELDLIHSSTANVPVSDNAMDTNWGGVHYSQYAVESGKYSDNAVTRINYPTPKGGMIIPIPNPYVPPRIPDV